MLGHIALAIGVAMPTVVGVAAAAEPLGPGDNRTEPYQLGAVIVTAPSGDVQAGQSTITIPATEIEALGARTLDESFGSTPASTSGAAAAEFPASFSAACRPGTRRSS